MVRWKAYGVLVLYVCVFSTCISAETQETGSTRHVWPAHIVGGVIDIVTTPSRTEEDATTQSSAGTIGMKVHSSIFLPESTTLVIDVWSVTIKY